MGRGVFGIRCSADILGTAVFGIRRFGIRQDALGTCGVRNSEVRYSVGRSEYCEPANCEPRTAAEHSGNCEPRTAADHRCTWDTLLTDTLHTNNPCQANLPPFHLYIQKTIFALRLLPFQKKLKVPKVSYNFGLENSLLFYGSKHADRSHSG